MKSISKFISLALLIAAATACNTKEIDKPDIPDQPQISGNVKFTASMKQTRVEYSVNGDKLHQCWEVDDVIYGFYGDNPVSKVTLKVTEVDADTEQATLEATDETEGAAFIAAIKEKGTDLKVGLLYTGSDNEVSGNTITVDMSDQSEGRIPACIESSRIDSIIEDEESGDTIVYFKFYNVCAILEIQSLTGIAEESTETIDLKSVSVSGVDKSCTFTYDAPGFSQDSESGTGSTIIVSSSDDRPLKVDSDGNIIDANGNRSCIRIAVCQIIRPSTITITATSTASHQYISQYQGSLYSSECYIIRAKDVVAKTEDSFYFSTVKAAFDHAKTLSSSNSSNNTVTLVKSTIEGLGVHPTSGDKRQIEIDIDYNVTLDLNGCTLSLSGSKEWDLCDLDDEDDDELISDATECFSVSNGGKFTITDSKGPNSEGIYSGTITSSSDTDMIKSKSGSQITINGGSFEHTYEWSIVSNNGRLDVLAGNFESNYAVFDNYGTLNVSNEYNHKQVELSSTTTKFFPLIYNNDQATISIYDGATFNGKDGATIYNYRGIICVYGGTINSTNTNVIDNVLYYKDEYGYIDEELITDKTEDTDNLLPKVYIYGGTLKTTGGASAIQSDGYVYVDNNDYIKITGGDYHAILNMGKLEINGGTISSSGSYMYAAIHSEDISSEDIYPGEIEINGGTIYSENYDAINVSSASSTDKPTFTMSGGIIEGNRYGINFINSNNFVENIEFPTLERKSTGEITFTNGSTIQGGESAINGYSLP